VGARAWLSIATALTLGACFLDFEAYDPRLAGDGGASNNGGGGQGAGATGGASTATTTSTGGSAMGGGGSGGATPVCGTPELTADDFDDAEPSTMWWTWADPGATIGETNGAAVITLAEQTAGWSGFTSKFRYDLRDTRFFLEVPVVPNPATSALGAMTVIFDGSSYVQLLARAGKIEATQTIAGTWSQRYFGNYDPLAHRWWQIREEGGTLYWEVSPDGQEFTALASEPTAALFPMDLVRLELSAYTQGSEVSPGEVHFDNLMGGGPPATGWCAPFALTDDFSGAARGRGWNAWANGTGSHAQVAGELVIEHGPGSGEAAYYSAQLFDLTGAEALVEVPAVAAQTTSYVFFRLEIDGGHGVELLVSDGSLRARYELGYSTQTLHNTPFDVALHRWWKIREEGGIIHWESSSDGIRWKELAQLAAPIDVTALEVILGSGLASSTPDSDATVYDNYNLPP
jgi:hypothetical protein